MRQSIDVKDVRPGDWVKVPENTVPTTKNGLFLMPLPYAAEREVEEPKPAPEPGPKVGEWRCNVIDADDGWEPCDRPDCERVNRRVYRSTGWSPDTRREDIEFAPGRPCKVTGYAVGFGGEVGLFTEQAGTVAGLGGKIKMIYPAVFSFNSQGVNWLTHRRNIDVIERRKK